MKIKTRERTFASVNNGNSSDDLFGTDDDIAHFAGRSSLSAIDSLILLATHRPLIEWNSATMPVSARFNVTLGVAQCR